MSDQTESPEISRLWTEVMVAEILEPFHSDTKARLQRIPWVIEFPTPDLAAAALMMRWASRYVHGERPDDLIDALSDSAAEPNRAMPPEDARELVMVAVLMVHSGLALPDPRWWVPDLHAEHLAIACARETIATGKDPERLLRDRLGFSSPRSAEMLETAAHEPGVRFAADREEAGELADRLNSYFPGDLAEDVLKAAFLALPETLEVRLDLAFAAGQAAQMRTALVGARDNEDRELVAFLEEQLAALVEAAAGLSRLEVELMRLIDPDETLLFEVAAIAKKTLRVSRRENSDAREEVVPTGLTDLIDGQRNLEPALELYLGLAGQTFQQRIGPIISWSITFERLLPDGFDRDDALELGIGMDGSVDTEFLVRTTYDGEAADAHIYYPPDSATATIALAILALTRSVRVDFYILSGTRSIRHVSQGGVVFDGPLVDEVSQRAVERCRALMANGEEGAMKALEDENSGKDAPLIAFLMNDSGKSEQLLDARTPGASLGPGQTATPEQAEELAQAHRGLLEAEAKRIEDPGDDTRATATAQAAAYTSLVQRLRGPTERGQAKRSPAALEGSVEGVATERRAVVHLTIDSRGLELAWVDRAAGEVEVDLLTCSDVDLHELGEALRDPEAGSIASLDEPSGPGVALGRRLAEQADRRGVDQLLICSTRNLHQLPVHALRVGAEDDRRLIDVAEVAYAPSAAIVADLTQLDPRPGPNLIIVGGDLHHADDEGELVAHLAGDGETLAGDVGIPAAVLEALGRAGRVHVCAHGEYHPQDYLASSLLFPTDSTPEARLTVARILAEADLAGIELAVLGACQSGAGQTEAATLDVAGGIDTAFLAAGVLNVLSALWEIDDFGALLFHGEFYRCLSEGLPLFQAYRSAANLLRSGAWRGIDDLPLGDLISDLGIDLEAAFAELEPGGDGEAPVDFADIVHWAPYRICGLGELKTA
jgi:CHAT domain-containing protein